jgi:hypothetical protein
MGSIGWTFFGTPEKITQAKRLDYDARFEHQRARARHQAVGDIGSLSSRFRPSG